MVVDLEIADLKTQNPDSPSSRWPQTSFLGVLNVMWGAYKPEEEIEEASTPVQDFYRDQNTLVEECVIRAVGYGHCEHLQTPAVAKQFRMLALTQKERNASPLRCATHRHSQLSQEEQNFVDGCSKLFSGDKSEVREDENYVRNAVYLSNICNMILLCAQVRSSQTLLLPAPAGLTSHMRPHSECFCLAVVHRAHGALRPMAFRY